MSTGEAASHSIAGAERMGSQGQSDDKSIASSRQHVVVVPLIVILTWLVYLPTLNRTFVSDHLWYLAELEGSRSLRRGLELTDYTAVRRYWKGDEVLFRPLMYVVWAVENAQFGVRHAAWNAFMVGCHALTGVALYALLWRIQPTRFAGVFACLFVVHPGTFGLVTWNHMGGYVIAFALGLTALTAAYGAIDRRGETSLGQMAFYSISMSLSLLFYEFMAVVCASLAVVVAWRGLGRRCSFTTLLWILSPLFVFGILYVGHVQRSQRLWLTGSFNAAARTSSDFQRCIVPAGQTVAAWIATTAAPSTMRIFPNPYDRLTATMTAVNRTLLEALLCGGLSIVWLRTRPWRIAAQRGPLLFVLTSTLIVYAGSVVAARGERWGPSFIANAYYFYLPTWLCVVGAYALWDWASLSRSLRRLVFVLLASLAASSGEQFVSTGMELHSNHRQLDQYYSRLAEFVENHRHEDDFRFRLDRPANDALDPKVKLIEGYPDDPAAAVTELHVSEILFLPHYDATNPKYVLTWNREERRFDVSSGRPGSGIEGPPSATD